jgi:hypothetical protein
LVAVRQEPIAHGAVRVLGTSAGDGRERREDVQLLLGVEADVRRLVELVLGEGAAMAEEVREVRVDLVG